MRLSLIDIAKLLGGEIKGKKDVVIEKVATLQKGEKGSISFLSNPKYESFIYSTNASAVIVDKGFVPKETVQSSMVLVDDAYTSMSVFLEEYERIRSLEKKGKESPSFVSESASIGDNAYIGAFSYIGDNVTIGNNVKIFPHCYIGDNCAVGDNTILYSGVKLYKDTEVGSFCTLHSGAVVGSDGFGFAPQESGAFKKVPQVGQVIIKDYVEIGANTCIDRGAIDATVIEKGVKVDNLVQIAHNVTVGENTAIASQTGIAGSTVIGRNCIFAGQVGVVGHVSIADNTIVASKSGVSNSITKSGKTLFGYPAMDIMDNKKSFIIYKKLPQLMKQIKLIEDKVTSLEGKSV